MGNAFLPVHRLPSSFDVMRPMLKSRKRGLRNESRHTRFLHTDIPAV